MNAVVLEQTATGAQTVESAPTQFGSRAHDISYELIWTTADGQGSIQVHASNDYNPQASQTGGTWVDISDAVTKPVALPTINNANGKHLIDLTGIPFAAVKVVYVQTSGTTTMKVIVRSVPRAR